MLNAEIGIETRRALFSAYIHTERIVIRVPAIFSIDAFLHRTFLCITQ